MDRGRYVVQAGVIAALYGALTLLVIQSPLGYGPIQFRISEAVMVMAMFTPAAIPGLWLGAVVANAFMIAQLGAIGLLDVVFGGLGSLLGAVWVWRFRRKPAVAVAGPVFSNALIVPAYLPVMLSTVSGLDFYRIDALGLDLGATYPTMYLFGVVSVGIGQAVIMYGLGLPLASVLRRRLPILFPSVVIDDE